MVAYIKFAKMYDQSKDQMPFCFKTNVAVMNERMNVLFITVNIHPPLALFALRLFKKLHKRPSP